MGNYKWEGIAELFKSRTKPDADDDRGSMFEVIQGVGHNCKEFSKEGGLAIADDIKSLPAIKNALKSGASEAVA